MVVQVSKDVAREMGLPDVVLHIAQVVIVETGWELPRLPPVRTYLVAWHLRCNGPQLP